MLGPTPNFDPVNIAILAMSDQTLAEPNCGQCDATPPAAVRPGKKRRLRDATHSRMGQRADRDWHIKPVSRLGKDHAIDMAAHGRMPISENP